MNDLPRHTLSRIIAKDGRGICDTPKRVEALLRDLCGAHRREINIIIGALEERVAADLITAAGNNSAVPHEVLLARLAARLRDNLAYTPDAARWAVETWAFALGILSEAELRERERRESAEASRSNAQPPVKETKPSLANPAASVSPQKTPPQPPRGTTYAPSPPPQPSQSPKQNQTPSAVRKPAPAPPRRMPTAHPNVVVAPAGGGVPRQNFPPSLPSGQTARRGGLRLRGCLISLVLIILLIVAAVFVVPAVILVLQEEQAQPSINDPRNR